MRIILNQGRIGRSYSLGMTSLGVVIRLSKKPTFPQKEGKKLKRTLNELENSEKIGKDSERGRKCKREFSGRKKKTDRQKDR